MASVREQIVSALATVLADTTGVTGVYRSRTEAASREESPCIFVRARRELPGQIVHPYAERRLIVEVAVIARGDEADSLADPVMVSAHGLIYAAAEPGGDLHDAGIIDVTEAETVFEYEDADGSACTVSQFYELYFRHKVENLDVGQ